MGQPRNTRLLLILAVWWLSSPAWAIQKYNPHTGKPDFVDVDANGDLVLQGSTGPDIRWTPTGGDTFHLGAEFASGTGSLAFFSNLTDGKLYWLVDNNHNFYFPLLAGSGGTRCLQLTNSGVLGVASGPCGTSSGITSLILSGDSGSDQTLTDGDTLEVAGGTGITTAGGATDKVTVTLDLTELSSATLGAGSFTTLTFDSGATDPVFTAGNGTITLAPGGSDFIVSDDVDIQLAVPTLKLTDTTSSQDDFEWWADASIVGLSNVTDGKQLLTFDSQYIAYLPQLPNCSVVKTNAAGGLLCGSAGSGTVTSITAGTGLTGGTITTSGTIALDTPVSVGNGGTGATTLTDGGILLGSGTGAVTPLGVAANGEIPIGDGTTDPVLATITGTTNQVAVSNGAGTITLSTPQDIATASSPTFADLTLSDTTPTLILTDTSSSQDDFEIIADNSAFFISNTTDGIQLLYFDSTNNAYIPTLASCTGDIETNALGKLVCGTDQTGAGGGDSITVNSSAATDPDFANGDIDWTLTGGNSITATVGCTDCVALSTETSGNYVLDVADGTGIDGTAAAEGATYTPTLDLTEISSTTWGAGSFTTMTFDAGTCDPRLTMATKTLSMACVNGTNNESLTWDFDTTANKVDVSTTTGVTDITFSAMALDIQATVPTLKLTDTTGSSDDFEWAADASAVYLSNFTDGVQLLVFDINNAAYLPQLPNCSPLKTNAAGQILCSTITTPDAYEMTLMPQGAVLDDTVPPALTVIESTGNGTPRFYVADFDATADEILYWTFQVPSDVGAGPWVATVAWYSNDTGANETAVWNALVSCTTEGDADTMAEQAGSSLNAAQEDVNTTEANRLIDTPMTMTFLDSVAGGDTCTITFSRDGNGAADDLTSDARLVGVLLQIPRT